MEKTNTHVIISSLTLFCYFISKFTVDMDDHKKSPKTI